MTKQITVETTINAPIDKVWRYWTEPEHITKWAFASEDWYAPKAENNLVVDGKFLTRMEARDGSAGFDFVGTYTVVERHKEIEYVMDDGRKVLTKVKEQENGVKVTETFDPENENALDFQKAGWQAILENFKKYVLEH